MQIQNEEVVKKIIDYLTQHKLLVNASIVYKSLDGGEIALKGDVSSLTPNTSIIMSGDASIKLTGNASINQNGYIKLRIAAITFKDTLSNLMYPVFF